MKHALFFALLLITGAGYAQDCDPLTVLNKPAQIRRIPDIERRSAFKQDLPYADKVIRYLDTLFVTAYRPSGLKTDRFAFFANPNKHQGDGSKLNKQVHSSAYEYTLYNFGYYCANGKFAIEGLKRIGICNAQIKEFKNEQRRTH